MSRPTPPKNALQFLRWFCRDDYLEEIEGNLLELYSKQHQESPTKARRMFIWNVLRHLRPAFIRSFNNVSLTHPGMFRNYFKIAWRHLLKQKQYALINIGGLAVGLTCFLLIFLYVQHELSYDRFYANADQIYRVYQRQAGNPYMGTEYFAYTTVGLAPALIDEFPEVTQATTFQNHTALLGYAESNYYEEGLQADSRFFGVFPYPFRQGNPETALAEANSIVVTRSLAEKIFGDQDPVGQSLIYRGGEAFRVTGVMEDPPTNASLRFSFVVNIQSANSQYASEMAEDRWNNNAYYTFFTLSPQADPQTLQDKFPALVEKYVKHEDTYPFQDSYWLQPLSALHLETNLNFDIGLKGNPAYISLFSLIAAVVLLLACVNYVNLAIARSIKRATEVGLRKVVGARRGQLIGQFMGESVLITFLALLVALGLTHFLLPAFGYLLERPIELNLIKNGWLLPGLLALVGVVGVCAGSYPAFLMSSLRPIQALKGSIGRRFSGMKIRQWLMVGQYAVSIGLMISSLVIYRQFQFIEDQELGYDKDHIVTVSVLDLGLLDRLDVLKNEWLANPDIISVTAAAELPTNVTSGTVIRPPGENGQEGFNIYRARVSYDYLKVFGIALIAGRDFSSDIASDLTEARIINETAAQALGWTPEEAIGKQYTNYNDEKKTVIGVVKDFHLHSMHRAIAPLLLELGDSYLFYIALKVRPENLSETIGSVEKSIERYSPYPFEYQFLDERFDQLYKADRRLGEIFGFFTLLSVLIASLGLFGMAAFTARQRTKEIGIRKVLGASVNTIVRLLSQDFLKLVLVGFAIAIPLAWYAMQRWLADFAYRVELEWWVFALAGIIAIVIAWFTVGLQTVRAARVNPVECLRDE